MMSRINPRASAAVRFVSIPARLTDSRPRRRSRPRRSTGRRLEVSALEPRIALSTYPLSSVPALSSQPGAKASIYLDFVGDTEASWGSYSNITTPAYDTDGDPTTFSDAELSNIQQIWQGVAEDYSPFNINVTTVVPSSFAHGATVKVVVGGDGAWSGGTYGGLSFVGAFADASLPNVSFVFSKNIANGNPKYTGDASSHEAGHEFGLQHQSLWSGTTLVQEYYTGPGDGTAPIMGSSNIAPLSRWWYGTSDVSSTTMQDDMAVISGATNGFGYRPTPSNETAAAAAPLAVSGNSVSTSGVIQSTSEQDYYAFITGAGSVTLSANVPKGVNDLTPQIDLLDSTGTTVLATAGPGTNYNATITTTLAAGTYLLRVESSGGYGNVGQYTVSGTVLTPANSICPPTNLAATSISTSQVNLTWTDNATNETGNAVERSTDGVNWTVLTSSLPAASTSFSDSTAAAGTTYDYVVYAYNASGSSLDSNQAWATTITAAPSGLAATAASSSQVNLSWQDVTGETGFTIRRSLDGSTWSTIGTTGAGALTYSDTTVSPSTTYYYQALATDAGGSSAPSASASATTPATQTIPNAPSNLTATAGSATKVVLNWQESSTGVTGFTIQRSSNGGKSWSQLAQVGGNVLTYTDTSVSKQKTYSYRVYASNTAGNSPYSNVATVTTPSKASLPRPDGPLPDANDIVVLTGPGQAPAPGSVASDGHTATQAPSRGGLAATSEHDTDASSSVLSALDFLDKALNEWALPSTTAGKSNKRVL